MIRITVELFSARTGERSILGVMDICNDGTAADGTGNSAIGNYIGKLYRKGSTETVTRGARVVGHRRRAQPVWVLVKKMLQEMYDG